MELDRAILLELLDGQSAPAPGVQHALLFDTSERDPRLADPLARLLELADHPDDIPVLAPLIRREITWRLLQGHFAPLLRQLAWPQGDVGRIATSGPSPLCRHCNSRSTGACTWRAAARWCRKSSVS